MGELAAAEAKALAAEFEADYSGTEDEPPRFASVAVTDELLENAAELVATYGLRAYDSIQLASARAARDVSADCKTLACFDSNLSDAAQAEGFELIG